MQDSVQGTQGHERFLDINERFLDIKNSDIKTKQKCSLFGQVSRF